MKAARVSPTANLLSTPTKSLHGTVQGRSAAATAASASDSGGRRYATTAAPVDAIVAPAVDKSRFRARLSAQTKDALEMNVLSRASLPLPPRPLLLFMDRHMHIYVLTITRKRRVTLLCANEL